ncbi:CHAT domain-containing protein [Lactarius quietus]|nr:CHAT domain-containing protein [Lactarius quietus]
MASSHRHFLASFVELVILFLTNFLYFLLFAQQEEAGEYAQKKQYKHNVKCYKCHRFGHYKSRCSKKLQDTKLNEEDDAHAHIKGPLDLQEKFASPGEDWSYDEELTSILLRSLPPSHEQVVHAIKGATDHTGHTVTSEEVMQLATNECGHRATKSGKNSSEEAFATKPATKSQKRRDRRRRNLKANCQAKRIDKMGRCLPRQNDDDANHRIPNARGRNNDEMYNRRSHNTNCNDHANVLNTWPNALDIEENAATKETEANEPDISQAVHIVITAPIIDLIREPEVQNNLHGSKTPPLQHMSPLFLLLKICQIIPSRATTFIMDILRYLTGTKTHALTNSNKRLVLFEFTIANDTSQFHYDTTSGFIIPIDIATISRVSHSQLEEPPIQLNLTPAEAEYLATAQAAKDRSNLRQNAEPSLEPLSSPFRTPHLFLSDAKFVTLPIVSNASHSKTDMSPDATEAAHSQKTIFYKAIGSPIYASDTTCINIVYSSPRKTLPKHKVLSSLILGVLPSSPQLLPRRGVLDSIRFTSLTIGCLRDAEKACPPGSYEISYVLAYQLYHRFTQTPSNDDYEDATALFEKILDPKQPGECPKSIRDIVPFHAAVLALTGSAVFLNPEYTEVAISRFRGLLSSPLIDEESRFQITDTLSLLVGERVKNYNLVESLEEANSYQSQAVDIAFQSLNKYGEFFVRENSSTAEIQREIHHLEEVLSNTQETSDHKSLLIKLADGYETKFSRTKDISDIKESIKYLRLLLDATDPSDVGRVDSLSSLCEVLFLAFKHTNNISYIEESITLGYDGLESNMGPDYHQRLSKRLAISLLSRWRLLGRREDSDECIRLMSLVVGDQYAREHDRFPFACAWAKHARRVGHPSVITAYKSAMSLMQKSLSFAPTVSTQHTRLVAMGDFCRMMPLDYASHQIDLGRLEEAIVILEQGRALLWSEMRGLRTPVAQLVEEDSPLAQRLSKINQELEKLTISITPSGKLDGAADFTNPFSRHVVKQRKLVEERDALVLQIQGLPGMEGFLMAPSFNTLRSAASHGPVIIINHCKWRSDILILFHDSPPCSIPTHDYFYDSVNILRDKLAQARKHGLDSPEYQDALSFVLKGLYIFVGEPVIEKLRVLGVPEQSRVWWCPTSVFCSLPLHAMGPIPSSDSQERYFSDLYIPSYTPSLSALIESRKKSTQMPDKPSLFLVAQPDHSLPGVKGEIKVIRKLEEQATVTALVSSAATIESVVDGLRGSQLAHFACHGVLETGKPFDASFKLHGGSRLTLLKIAQSRLPNAEFAFLSCCHAAEITGESVVDEALHLTAAMQYCGFRSVIGTMWEMADTDGRDLAKKFYGSLFSSEEPGVPYYERTAGALRVATQELRKKRGISLERWVNFVHYGA